MRRPLPFTLPALILLAMGGAAQAQDRTFRPLSASVLDFERRGHVVRSAEDDGRTHEIEATTRDGRRIEAIVEAATGEVLSERADD